MSEQLTDSECWCLTTEVDGVESLVGSKALRIIDAQAATLERVGAAINDSGLSPVETCMAVRAALAGQPEAPKGQETERPGESQLLAGLRAANAEFSDKHDKMASDLAAANARIAELEVAERLARATANAKTEALRQTDVALVAANARADAAERRYEAAEQNVTWVRTERDQLAARVKEMSADFAQCNSNRMLAEERCARLSGQLVHDLTKWCTPEERAVLEAIPLVILEARNNRFTPSLRSALNELANRAAKSKRGDK